MQIHTMRIIFILVASLSLCACQQQQASEPTETEEFPFLVPAEKPNRPLSAAVKRNYEAYEALTTRANRAVLSVQIH